MFAQLRVHITMNLRPFFPNLHLCTSLCHFALGLTHENVATGFLITFIAAPCLLALPALCTLPSIPAHPIAVAHTMPELLLLRMDLIVSGWLLACLSA